jgi:hypothetical protein
MTEHPILFSTEMVKAILEGRKTQTRRVNKLEGLDGKDPYYETREGDLVPINDMCPYGQVDDLLWVRETHYSYGKWIFDGFNKTGSPRYKFAIDPNGAVYFENNKPSPENIIKKSDIGYARYGWTKRPSIFLFRCNSRITLEITEIRVQRLQEISEEDCIAEGIIPNTPFEIMKWGQKYKSDYVRLWDSINGKTHPWESNPWVWAITFKKIS